MGFCCNSYGLRSRIELYGGSILLLFTYCIFSEQLFCRGCFLRLCLEGLLRIWDCVWSVSFGFEIVCGGVCFGFSQWQLRKKNLISVMKIAAIKLVPWIKCYKRPSIYVCRPIETMLYSYNSHFTQCYIFIVYLYTSINFFGRKYFLLVSGYEKHKKYSSNESWHADTARGEKNEPMDQ